MIADSTRRLRTTTTSDTQEFPPANNKSNKDDAHELLVGRSARRFLHQRLQNWDVDVDDFAVFFFVHLISPGRRSKGAYNFALSQVFLMNLCHFRCTKRSLERRRRAKKPDRSHVRRVKTRRCYQRKPQTPPSKSQFWARLSMAWRKFHFSSSTTCWITRWCSPSWSSTGTFFSPSLWAPSSVTSSSDICRWRPTWKISKLFKPKSSVQRDAPTLVSQQKLFRTFFFVFCSLEVFLLKFSHFPSFPQHKKLLCRSFMWW